MHTGLRPPPPRNDTKLILYCSVNCRLYILTRRRGANTNTQMGRPNEAPTYLLESTTHTHSGHTHTCITKRGGQGPDLPPPRGLLYGSSFSSAPPKPSGLTASTWSLDKLLTVGWTSSRWSRATAPRKARPTPRSRSSRAACLSESTTHGGGLSHTEQHSHTVTAHININPVSRRVTVVGAGVSCQSHGPHFLICKTQFPPPLLARQRFFIPGRENHFIN